MLSGGLKRCFLWALGLRNIERRVRISLHPAGATPFPETLFHPRIPNPQQQLPESRRFGILENPEEIGIPFEEKISESNICLRVGVRGDSSLFDAEVVCDPLHFSSNYRGN